MVHRVPTKLAVRFSFWVPVLCIVAIVTYYALFLYTYAVNVPYTDDIWDILQFLVNVQQSSGWRDTFAAFYEQHNSHRTLSSRILYYLVYVIEGEANFRTLTFVANMAVPLLLAMLCFSIRDKRLAPLVLLSSAFILFQLRTFEVSFWPMTAFGFMYVFMYGFAAILCLQKASPLRLICAMLFASLASFSLISGQVIWVVGLASLTHQSIVLKSVPRSYIVWWTLCAIVVVLIFHTNYQSTFSIPLLVGHFLEAPLTLTLYFCKLLGSAAGQSAEYLANIAGIGMLCLTAYSTVRSSRKENIAAELFAWYVILSAISITLGRSIDGMESLFSPLLLRYIFLSTALLATMPVLLWHSLPARWNSPIPFALLAVVAAVYCGYSYHAYSPQLQVRLNHLTSDHNFKAYWSFGVPGEIPTGAVNTAISSGIYKPTKHWYAKYKVSPFILRVQEPVLWVPPKKKPTD